MVQSFNLGSRPSKTSTRKDTSVLIVVSVAEGVVSFALALILAGSFFLGVVVV